MKKVSILIGAAVAVALTPAWVWAQGQTDPNGYQYGPRMMWWGGGEYGFVAPQVMILLVALIVAVAALLVRWIAWPWHGGVHHLRAPGRTPLDILKERFARGEIDKTEFEDRRRVLGE